MGKLRVRCDKGLFWFSNVKAIRKCKDDKRNGEICLKVVSEDASSVLFPLKANDFQKCLDRALSRGRIDLTTE